MINSNYSYILPPELIASEPASPRDHSRLLVYKNSEIYHDRFFHLSRYLQSGDLLVVNNSKVIPARLFGKKETGGKIEILLLGKVGKYWDVLIGGRVAVDDKIFFDDNSEALIIGKDGKSGFLKFNFFGKDFWAKINQIGHMPIPPYIKNSKLSEKELKEEYQTIYAKNYGSAAAPTAGLHFSKKLIGELKSAGIGFAEINLHIGLGTFAPLTEENIKNNKLHSEKFLIPRSTIRKIIETKKTGGRIIAIGTTTVRALESSVEKILSGQKAISGQTDIFIQPGDKFKIVDGLITNFHLPCSSLMMLVAAFLQYKGEKNGREKLLELYKLAIEKNYRFYSFGDAMLII